MNTKPILSLFPGIDLLSKPFTQNGFCVVKGPDIAFGEDIKNFVAAPAVFEGIIGGSPCHDFSSLNRNNPSGEGIKMINEFIRCVLDADVDWFLFENVPRVPNIRIEGYKIQRFELDLGWYEDYTRLRHFQFGCKNGRMLNPPKLKLRPNIKGGCVTATGDPRTFRQMCDIQGLSRDFDLPHFSESGKKTMVGNGVPLKLGSVLVELILKDYYGHKSKIVPFKRNVRRCKCKCGREVIGKKLYYSAACRKRVSRARKKAVVTTPADASNYLGSKNGAGVKEKIINLIPPHLTYIEGFLGTGIIMRTKRPALQQYAIDLNQTMLDQFSPDFKVNKICTDVLKFLREYPYEGVEFIYLDPPYLTDTRSSNIRYEFEYSYSDHKRLLDLLIKLEAPILISGYASELYDTTLADWNREEFTTMSRGGPKTEVLWWNYDLKLKHDTQFTGSNKTERQAIARKVNRWKNKFRGLPVEQQHVILHEFVKSFKPKQ